ncbi:MraY family glycosyltransferase [Aliarcobacter butzleri]|uniref:MraY family glycosyltransferase n=1 Tax=Aliarcobacter butzleri TaxID=28197 RepID=UPI00263CAB93|nr:glycosyltransferase family 4 protein [Aliarcobacter butzleri]MDN5067896.1 glycosyltransferase family 4 protein [Aliarcobacter butzleri]MDN5072702.1 glycosyltransferase family 4 protein [Aliarcobacter butzleri]MDN5121680.1 glycosyltransferase family 4 protein [Aliarcobacter butzleri]
MIYIILLLISFLLTYFIKNYMIKKSLVASVNERSSHTVPTPHGGGISIAITWFIGLFYLYFIGQIENNLFYALLFGAVISIVSFFDDIYELSPKLRLIIQAIVAIGGLYFLGGFETLTFGIFDIQNPIFTNIFAFFMIIWFINLYNFLDGINGYAGSELLFLAVAGFILFGGNHFLVLAVAVLGFLYWNWNKAKIFMGDVGSTLLGYNVAIFTIYYANQEPNNFWIWIILFSVYWFDATLTLIRRKLNKEKLSQAHKKHAYQRLTQAGWSHYKVTNYSIGLNILLFAIVYFISNIFVAFLFSFVVLVLVMKFIDSKKAFE